MYCVRWVVVRVSCQMSIVQGGGKCRTLVIGAVRATAASLSTSTASKSRLSVCVSVTRRQATIRLSSLNDALVGRRFNASCSRRYCGVPAEFDGMQQHPSRSSTVDVRHIKYSLKLNIGLL